MRILVRHAQTGLYLAADRTWVIEPDAREFQTIEQAGDEAWQHDHASVALSYRDPDCQLILDRTFCAPERPHPRKPPF